MPWNKLFDSDIIINNNIRFREDLSLGEDLVFNLEYLDKTNGRILVINEPLYFYYNGSRDSLKSKYYPHLLNIYEFTNKELIKYIKKWDCSNDQISLYYNSCFYSYERVLRNTYHPKSTINNKHKFNKKVLKSNGFMESLSKSSCYINPLYRFAYEHHLARMLRFLDLITQSN